MVFVRLAGTYTGCIKKTEPLKFKLSASYSINLTPMNDESFELMIRKNTRSCTHENLMMLFSIKF